MTNVFISQLKLTKLAENFLLIWMVKPYLVFDFA